MPAPRSHLGREKLRAVRRELATPGAPALRSRLALVVPLLLGAAAARAGGERGAPPGTDPDDTIEVSVDVTAEVWEGETPGTLSFSWRGRIHRVGRGTGFDYKAPPSATPAAVGGGKMAPPFNVDVGFVRFETGETGFAVGLIGRCPKEGSRSMLTMRTEDSDQGSPFSLTEPELGEGFERSFTFRVSANQCEFAGDAVVRVTLRKGGEAPDVIVEGSHCACGAEGTAEVTARSASGEVVFEKFEVKGAPAGAVRRNEGGKAAHLTLGNAARSGGPVEAVAVYRHQGKTRRAPSHTVHLALVEKPKTKDNEKWGGNGGSDFAFDDGAPGHLEFEAEGRAWLDGRDVSTSLRWVAGGAEYLRPDPAAGARARFQADGLPRDNASFGRKKIRAVLEGQDWKCESEPREVRIFYWANAENGPQGKGTPNWAWYYRQTRAWNGADFSVGDFQCGVPAPNRAGGYDWCHDRIYLHPRRPEIPCRMPVGTPTERANRYIDCFAQTIRHEAHHRRELMEWWGGRTPEPTGPEDPDGDLVPAAVEARLGLGCRDEPPTTADQVTAAWQVLKGKLFGHPANVGVPPTQYSCALATSPLGPGRPFPDVIDSEIHAYYEGWKWQTGSADGEDWAWPGKNWPKE